MSGSLVENFAANWIDANIAHPSEPATSLDELQRRFLADAVAAGLKLDDVNDQWETVLKAIKAALRGNHREQTRRTLPICKSKAS